ncbi:MAG: hypothetical protein HFH67_16750 [Lachnospiraceae bacterium]|nr:hypothetical protein [uncultured Acetatifactor sp.]MCI8749480.1 hypothetical protein [Lachnospiraceae bacterium]MCI9572602.1 hypothetical protein [Lachnospiraceae bacterium]
MNKLLLIMPFFMDYQNILKNEMERYYEVTLINSDQLDKEILECFYACGKIRWGFRHAIKPFMNYEKEKVMNNFLNNFIKLVSNEINYYKIILCINGAYIPDLFYRYLREQNPKARFIYYSWDDIHNLFKQNHIRYFNERYMYNIQECKKYHATYLPMFVQDVTVHNEQSKEYDVALIASVHSDRKKIAEEIYKKYSSRYRIFIYLYEPGKADKDFCHTTPLTHEEYMNILRKSKAILDIPHIRQSGPTTRFFDALLTKTKVITTNADIVKYPIYSENIYITSRKHIIIDANFIVTSYKEIDYTPLLVSEWIKKYNV